PPVATVTASPEKKARVEPRPSTPDDFRRNVRIITLSEPGLRPQAATDYWGVIHLVYFQGQPSGGDLFYTRFMEMHLGASIQSSDGELGVIRVNSQPGSATIRGAQLALGKNGRTVHVAWNGSTKAEPEKPGQGVPMLYSRLDPSGAGFKPRRDPKRDADGSP